MFALPPLWFQPPRRQIKSKTDKTARFILVKKTPWCLKRRGKPCKVHETHFPSLKNLWKVYKQAGRKSLEYIRLLIWDVDSVTRVVQTPRQNFRIKHLDRVLNFKWKVCRKMSFNHRHTLIKIKFWEGQLWWIVLAWLRGNEKSIHLPVNKHGDHLVIVRHSFFYDITGNKSALRSPQRSA